MLKCIYIYFLINSFQANEIVDYVKKTGKAKSKGHNNISKEKLGR